MESAKKSGVIDTVRWVPDTPDQALPGTVRIIEQTLLPSELRYVNLTTVEQVWDAIKRLAVRGAPAIGIAAAYGLALAMQHSAAADVPAFMEELRRHAAYLISSRPTAVNLAWAVNRCLAMLDQHADSAPGRLKLLLIEEAHKILQEDIDMCRSIGEHGNSLLPQTPNVGILTHCNAGALATGDWGTALSVVYVAQERGLSPRVFSDETRPLLQGSRLTAWELHRAGVNVTVISDNMAAQALGSLQDGCVIRISERKWTTKHKVMSQALEELEPAGEKALNRECDIPTGGSKAAATLPWSDPPPVWAAQRKPNYATRVMKEGRINCVFVGSDRIAANGDAANKIGTYGVAILAHYHHIPFYVCAPSSTFDPTLASGELIPIEQRNPDEVRRGFGKLTAPADVPAYNPAFDVTPHELITAIVTEHGVLRPPYNQSIAAFISALKPSAAPRQPTPK
ncbi:putative Methylthioribose-1-phosphate isomerase 1 [Paratrimastix pyriformis]|uniref:Methylthioribose-1-phosphate isomerase n=1 Tax=Paratrimastix pyriformis TaxID=342808 RepID=A0ABQ8UDV3_9EUKA|nr:putative Methylthioribose-1-phosphate isomerase 1 [Paratrimastix pyriformis]